MNTKSEADPPETLNVQKVDAKPLKSGASDGTRTRDLRRDRPGKAVAFTTIIQTLGALDHALIGPLSERQCGACQHPDRSDGPAATSWCRLLHKPVTLAETVDCQSFEPLRMCGDCVVYNGDDVLGSCSIAGAVANDQAACRRFFAKDQLNAPLYGRKQ